MAVSVLLCGISLITSRTIIDHERSLTIFFIFVIVFTEVECVILLSLSRMLIGIRGRRSSQKLLLLLFLRRVVVELIFVVVV